MDVGVWMTDSYTSQIQLKSIYAKVIVGMTRAQAWRFLELRRLSALDQSGSILGEHVQGTACDFILIFEQNLVKEVFPYDHRLSFFV